MNYNVNQRVVLQELRTIAIYDSTKFIRIFFTVLDVAAMAAVVVLRLVLPSQTPSERASKYRFKYEYISYLLKAKFQSLPRLFSCPSSLSKQ